MDKYVNTETEDVLRKTELEGRCRCFHSFFWGGGGEGGWLIAALNWVECIFNLGKISITNITCR